MTKVRDGQLSRRHLKAVNHTFLERFELVAVLLTCVVKENKERDNRTTSVRVSLLTGQRCKPGQCPSS